MTIEIFAPAKINLALHVTGQRPDGYHLLESIVAFADIGDKLTFEIADETVLDLTGPFASDIPASPDNLVQKTANLLGVTAKISLEKNLPVASGIGGGSSDAAATLKGMTRLFDLPMPDRTSLLKLGADIPVCLEQGLLHMSGIGEIITPLPNQLTGTPILLINPGVAVSTPKVFSALTSKQNPGLTDRKDRDPLTWLSDQRNDLQAPATSQCREIATILTALQQSRSCLLARMSGSGATCFGLFETSKAARIAQQTITKSFPGWWVANGTLA